jgi:hypothetical protein
MDKTVKLWDITTSTCLKTFSHTDYGELVLVRGYICVDLLSFTFVFQFYLFGILTSIIIDLLLCN